jgi:hypothetical protein
VYWFIAPVPLVDVSFSFCSAHTTFSAMLKVLNGCPTWQLSTGSVVSGSAHGHCNVSFGASVVERTVFDSLLPGYYTVYVDGYRSAAPARCAPLSLCHVTVSPCFVRAAGKRSAISSCRGMSA